MLREKQILQRISLLSFYIFVFFVFFKTSLPFQEKGIDLENATTSNPLNQLVFGSLLIISILLLIPKLSKLKQFIKNDVYLTFFLAWAFLTILWSNNPDISFKRYILFLSTITVPLSYFFYTERVSDGLNIFYRILIPYIFVSIVSVFVTPLAHDFEGTWRGIHSDKNGFGQISLIALLIFVMHYRNAIHLKKRLWDLLFITISLILILGSGSSTVIFALIILLIYWSLTKITHVYSKIGMSRFILIFLIFMFISINLIFIFFVPEFFEPIAGAAGKDLTFTGRLYLWADIWEFTKNYILWGAGFRGFWVVTDNRLFELYNIYTWIPIQSHNGYLDIINETGLIGITIFFGIILKYFKTIKIIERSKDWIWFGIIALIINITESKFITPKAPLSVMFFFTYIAFIVNNIFVDQNMNKK